MKISNYDEYDYKYETYWSDRDYEHQAEVLAINKLLAGESGNWFIDIGGSYGRILDLYSNKYKNKVIIDYSLKTLQENYAKLSKMDPNLHLIAANAYYLPFKDNTYDLGIMVRVLHHIENPTKYFGEIARVIKSHGKYIQEIPNKVHIKAVLRAIFKLNFGFFNQKPIQQVARGANEGGKGDEDLFLNYHPKMIMNLLKSKGFKVISKIGVSYFRIPILKRLFGVKFLIILERIAQLLLKFTNIAPSIFVKTLSTKQSSDNATAKQLNDILCCPKCHSDLKFSGMVSKCSKCRKEYKKVKNIWDFRINES